MSKWWIKTVAAGLAGAVLGLAVGAAVIFSDPYRYSNTVNDAFYAGSPAVGAGAVAGIVGTRKLLPTVVAILVSSLMTGALIAAIRAELFDLTGVEPVVVLAVAGLSAAVGARFRPARAADEPVRPQS